MVRVDDQVLVAAARAGVIRELEAQTGTTVARVDVAVEDIVLDAAEGS